MVDLDKKKLTRITDDDFIIMTINNVNTVQHFQEKHQFKYVLPSVISQKHDVS